jgi:hypothetical protein
MAEDENKHGRSPEEGNTYSWGKYFNVMFGNQWGRREMHIGYWWGSQKERDH